MTSRQNIVASFKKFQELNYPWLQYTLICVSKVTGDEGAFGCFYLNEEGLPIIEYKNDLDGGELVAILMHELGHLLNVLNTEDNETHGSLWQSTQDTLYGQWLLYLEKQSVMLDIQA